MGLIGMARRAGAAKGAYLAAQEAYHRQRQGMLDDITRQRFELDKAKHAQDMTVSKNTEARNAEKHAFNMASGKAKEEREAAKHAQDMTVSKNTEARNAALFNQGQEDRKNFIIPANQARLDAMDRANEQAERNLQRQDDLYNRRMAAMNRMSQQDRDNYLLYGAGKYNPSLVKMAQSGRRSAAPAAKPPFSDTRIENIAAHATPEQMRDTFDQVYNITEKDMQRKTGKTRDQFFKDVNDAYAEHIRIHGSNAMTRHQFLEQYEKQYAFRPIHDLNKYMDASNEDAAKKPSAMGNWFREYIYGKPYGTYHYAKKNPTIVGKQEKLTADIITGFGGKPNAQNIALIRNPQFVKKFMAARNKGLSPQDAVKFVLGGAR